MRDRGELRRIVRLYLATDREALRLLFRGIGELEAARLVVVQTPLDRDALLSKIGASRDAAVALVDVTTDLLMAIDICSDLAAGHPLIPIGALYCCPHSVDSAGITTLSRAGVTSALDLQLPPDELLRSLHRIAGGEHVISLGLTGGFAQLWRELLPEHEETGGQPPGSDLALLDLLRQGLTDHEMGIRLRFSPHTVKHQLERVRAMYGARNRIELAALVGRHGVFSPETGVLVRLELETIGTVPAGRAS